MNGNPLDEEDGILLDKVNLMYLQCVQKAMKKGIQLVLNLDEKSMSLGIRGFA